MTYSLLLFKRSFENIFIYPFVLVGRIIAYLNPLKKEYRVFFFFPFYHTGGAEKVHAQIASGSGGSDCIIFFTKKSIDDRFLDEFRKSRCEIRNISKWTDNKWFYFFNLLYRGIITGYINRQTQQPIVFNGQCNFGYKISPWVKKRIPQLELIHSLNTFSYIRIPFLPFINKTVMISKKRITEHKELYKRYGIPIHFFDRIQHIPNAINLPKHVEPKIDNDLTVLYVGRGTGEKRVQLVGRIAMGLRNIQFEILGDVSGSIDQNDYHFIKFHGNLKDEKKIAEIYTKAHVLILTSTTEGFPMVIQEAMAYGCAILSTAVGDIPYHVKNHENGFLFSDVNDESLLVQEAIEKISWLKNNRLELKRMSVNNIDYAKHNFGIDRFNKDYRDLFLSVKPQP